MVHRSASSLTLDVSDDLSGHPLGILGNTVSRKALYRVTDYRTIETELIVVEANPTVRAG